MSFVITLSVINGSVTFDALKAREFLPFGPFQFHDLWITKTAKKNKNK